MFVKYTLGSFVSAVAAWGSHIPTYLSWRMWLSLCGPGACFEQTQSFHMSTDVVRSCTKCTALHVQDSITFSFIALHILTWRSKYMLLLLFNSLFSRCRQTKRIQKGGRVDAEEKQTRRGVSIWPVEVMKKSSLWLPTSDLSHTARNNFSL